MAECVNDVCSDITIVIYIIIKKGIKRIGTNRQGFLLKPPGVQEPSAQHCLTGMMTGMDKGIHLVGLIY